LHSSITSSVVSVSPLLPCCCCCCFGVHASSNSPSRSPLPGPAPPRPSHFLAPSAASRACMMDMILLLSCLFRRRTCRLRRVGRYLNKQRTKLLGCWCCMQKRIQNTSTSVTYQSIGASSIAAVASFCISRIKTMTSSTSRWLVPKATRPLTLAVRSLKAWIMSISADSLSPLP
jgi:hypothetical protein